MFFAKRFSSFEPQLLVIMLGILVCNRPFSPATLVTCRLQAVVDGRGGLFCETVDDIGLGAQDEKPPDCLGYCYGMKSYPCGDYIKPF